ncbi:MAG: transcription/translation regulatory transformer protein RfaH [Gammaproteobacteria bacterium]|nr:transcription/translation regulatory transformer protein RfaH [Gammaproteobacteria bacterium]
MQGWYLVFSKPRQERVALRHLERQAYRVFLPQVLGQQRHRGRLRPRVAPMFPRYLFIQLDDRNQDWSPIRSTLGVTCMVRFGDRPAQVPEPLIDALLARQDPMASQRSAQRPLRRGESVRIVSGALAGVEAIFDASTSAERVRLLLDMVGRQTPVLVDARHVQALHQARSQR